MRFWGIEFGLPHTQCRPDESFIVSIALHFLSGDLNPPFFYYPSFYMYVLSGLYACYFIFGFPGETDETAATTREFIKSIEHPELEGMLSWSMFPFILSPMSPIYEPEMRERYGLTGYMQNWKHRTMDSGRAMEHIRKTFLELEDSGPVSRGDNLDMLFELAPHQRKKLIALRHKLSKLEIKSQSEKREIVKTFSTVIPLHKAMRGELIGIR